MQLRACRSCNHLGEDAVCPLCGGPTSKNWTGLLAILDPERSELAEAMNITRPGNYALKVR